MITDVVVWNKDGDIFKPTGILQNLLHAITCCIDDFSLIKIINAVGNTKTQNKVAM